VRSEDEKQTRQGILPFVLTLGEQEDVTASAGLPLVIETMRALRLDRAAVDELPAPKRARGYGADEKLEALVTLVAAGGDRIEDIRILGEDKGLVRLLGRPFPSPDALLDFLRSFHSPEIMDARPVDAKSWVPPESAGLAGLDRINRLIVERGSNKDATTATIDHDGTIIEAKKRDAHRAYEGTRGYQPLVAVWAEQQLVVADEFRDANVPGGQNPLASARRAFEALPQQVARRYFRGDSASYYQPLLEYLVSTRVEFCISADMTESLRSVCMAIPSDRWAPIEDRVTEEVHVAEVEFAPGDWPRDAQPLRYVSIRFTPKQTDLFEERSTRHFAIVSNRYDMSMGDLVSWHREKAGTIEQVHRTMKDELGAGVMPCGVFGANAAWFRINAIAFNVLTVLKRRALPARFEQARPKRLRFEVFAIPAKLSIHQSRLSARCSASEPRLNEIIEARQRLLHLQRSAA